MRGACKFRQRPPAREYRQVPVGTEQEFDLANLTVHFNLKARVHYPQIQKFHHAEKAWLRKEYGIGQFKGEEAND